MNTFESIIVLNMLPAIGPRTAHKLIASFDSPENIFKATKPKLASILKENELASILNWEQYVDLNQEIKQIQEKNIQLISILSNDYPPLLKEIHTPPLVLYIQGNPQILKNTILSIVGSRKASLYGILTSEKLAEELVSYNITIASGLALGIDTAAHRGALNGKGMTIGILGNGLSTIYPKDNEKLALTIIEKGGAIVSEFPMTMPPLPQNFPRRNRIVVGMSLGVIVTEAANNSGALITANIALDEGRLVFSVPGKIDSMSSQGTNSLIKQGAKLITCANDILEEFEHIHFPKKNCLPQNKNLSQLTPQETTIYNILSQEETHLDQINEQTEIALPIIISTLLSLELKKLIKQLPGKQYITI